ncbi:MAG: tetratricopeptide repeat protein [Xanthobacteraceae bacterium]
MTVQALSGETRRVRRIAAVSLAALLAASTSACQTARTAQPDASYAMAAAPPQTGAHGNQSVAAWGNRYRTNPRDPAVAINYAHALRVNGQRAQAVAVLEQASIHNPSNMQLLGAYGRALADVGNYKQALEVLNRAHTPDRPDWRILNVQGAVLDQVGRNEDARRYYMTALRIVPDEPSVLSNLGLSYALSRDLPRAEATLKRATAGGRRVDPRVRQNLALVVGLQGRFAEAEAIARADLPPAEAAANVAYLRQLLSQQSAAARRSGRS